MSSFDISVQVDENFGDLVSDQWLEGTAQRVLALESPAPEAKVSVIVSSDQVVRDLNKRHRGLDENTDVLAFSFSHQGEYHGEHKPSPQPDERVNFVLPPGETESLGEVVISYPQAKRQAAQSGHPVLKELAILLTHGLLHLLGHDHAEPEKESVMRRIEAQVLAQVWRDSE